jgi:hypothetical protein
VLFGLLSSLSCGTDLPPHHTTVAGRVFWAGPVEGAKVQIFQVLPSGALYQDAPFAEATTDHDGNFTLDVGQQGNILLLTAAGGAFDDPVSGTRIVLDNSTVLRGYQQHVALDEVRSTAVLSPITTLQADLADARRQAGRPDSVDGDSSIDRARALLGTHLLDLNAENTIPADVFSPAAATAPSPTSEYRYGLLLAGLSAYASEIGTASGQTIQDLNITHLTAALSADLTSTPDLLFNGHTATAFSRVGACPVKANCPAGTDFDAKPECRTPCDLFANSPRAYLARAILAWLGTSQNKSGIKPEDLRSRLEQVAANNEPELFGDTPPEPLLNVGPTITYESPLGTVKGLVDLKVTATSPVGVKSLTVTWDGTTTNPALVDANPDPAVFEVHGLDTTQLADAVWTFTATAYDSLDNHTDNIKNSITVDNIGSGTVSGIVWGPVAGATVRAYAYANGVKGALLGTATTDPSGAFVNLLLQQGYSGPLLIEAGFSGTYTEDASPVQVTVDTDNVLRTVVGSYADGAAVGQIVITPITSFAAAYLDWKVANAGATPNVTTLWNEAVAVMQAQFDVPDIQHLTPAAPGAIVTLSSSARYSLVLTGLSERAILVSSTRPGGTGDAGSFPSVVNSLVVTAKLENDLRSDGCWNAKAGATELLYGGTTKLSKDDTRIGLASAIVAYVQGPENQTPFANAGDLLGLLDTLSNGGISTGAGGCPGGGIYPDDGTGYDQVGPTVIFTPEPGDLVALDPVVRGTIHLVATGDDHGVDPKPSTVIQREASPNPIPLVDTDGDSSDADAHVTIDTVALGEGPQTLTAKSTDDSGNVGTVQHSFIADNLAPVLSVAGVQNGDTYADNRVITFTQTDANPGTTTATLNGVAFTSGAQVTADGDYTLVVNGSDQAGNAAAPVSLTFHLNRLGPVITITGVAANQYYNTTRTITFAQNGTGGTISATLNGLPFTSGSMVTLENDYDLVVNATNAAGLTGTSSVRFTIDTTAPVITFAGVANNGAYKQDVFVTFGQNDLHKGTTTALLNTAAIGNGTTVSAEADYTLALTATDLAGNVATPVNVAFVVDKTAPTIAITGVANGQYYNAARTIGFTAPGEPHLASLTATLNGTPFTSGSGVTLDNGYTLVVTATDTAGNTATQTVGFTIDTIKPVLTYSGFTNGQFVKQDVTIVLGQTEVHAGPIVATLDGAPFTSGSVVSGEGLHTLVLNTTDLAGNVATQVTATFTIDKQAPTITVTGVTNGQYTKLSPTVGFSANEPATLTATLDGVAFTSGTVVSSEATHTLLVDAIDLAGNAAVTKMVVFTVDRTVPVLSYTGFTNGQFVKQDVTIVLGQMELHAGPIVATLDGAPYVSGTPVSSEQLHTLVLNTTDLAGNVATQVTATFTIDKTPPTITVGGVSNNAYYNGSKTPTFTISELGGTLSATLDGSAFTSGTTVSAEGPHTLVVNGTDKAGNAAMPVTVIFTIDVTAPTITLIGPGPNNGVANNGAYNSNRTLAWSLSETGTTTATLTNVTLGGTQPITSPSSITAVTNVEATYHLVINGADFAGNAAAPIDITFAVDLKPPTITVAGVTNGAFYSAAKTISFSQADLRQGTTTATLGGVAFTSGTTVSAPGAYTLHVDAVDAAGNTSTSDVGFVIDMTPPVVTITGVTEGTWYPTAVGPIITISDTYLQSQTITLDGGAYVSGTPITVQGAHTLSATATDKAGTSTSKTVHFTVDTSPPVIAWDPTTPLNGAQLRSAFNVIASATDNLSLTGFAMTAPAGQSDIDSALDKVYVTLTPSTLGDQDLTVTLTAQDQAGGIATASRTYVLDTTKPTITPATTGFVPVNGTLWTTMTAVTLTGTAIDAHLASVKITKGATQCGTSTAANWSIALGGCLAAGSNALVVTAVDGAGNVATVDVTVGVDASVPTVTVANSTVIDESADTVATFNGTTAQAPVHTHSVDPGKIPDLDASNCSTPVTLKLYAYLHDQGGAPFGSETTTNPFTWSFTSADPGAGIDPVANPTQYRVSYWDATNTTQTVLIDWSNLTGTTNGDGSVTYAVTLFRKLVGGVVTRPALPEIGTLERKFQIDFRTVDRLANTTTQSRCWDNRPLAAPLSIQAAQVASTTNSAASGRVALTTLKLNPAAVTNPSIPTYILNSGSPGSGLTEFTVTNMTAEPVYVQVGLTPPTSAPTYAMTAQRGYIETSKADQTPGTITCATLTGQCLPYTTLTSSAPSSSGTLANPAYALRVFDTTNIEKAESICSGCGANQYLLAGRPAASTKGNSYLVQSVIQTIPEMRPTGTSGTYADFTKTYYTTRTTNTTATMSFTGQVFSTKQVCDKWNFVPMSSGGDPAYYDCLRTGTYTEYVAIGAMSINYGNKDFTATVDATTAIGATAKVSSMRVGPALATPLTTSQALPALP